MEYTQGMDKIRDEMAKGGDELHAIGEYMTRRLEREPAIADKLEGKTLKAAFEAIEKYAKKNRGGKSCVYVPPETAMRLVCEYYGIAADDGDEEPRADRPAVQPGTPHDDELDLDKLLGV